MPRQARIDQPGLLNHVIFRGIERREIFRDADDYKEFLARLAQVKEDAQVFSWALMPNHGHLLVRSGSKGLSGLMRRLLTGYAVYFNRRHRRIGHLFQNRYKSVVCDEDIYFKTLVRYIHMNPLKAKLVANLEALAGYWWCGHGAILGRRKNDPFTGGTVDDRGRKLDHDAQLRAEQPNNVPYSFSRRPFREG